MATAHGSSAVFKIGTHSSPAVVTNLSQYGNSVGLSLNRETGEVTTFAAKSKKYVPGLKDATVPFEGPWDDQSDVILWDLYNHGTMVNFEYFPAGEGVGKPKYSGQCIITSYEVSSEVSDPNATSGEFQVSGDVTRAVG